MTITLNPELEASVHRRVASGEFADETAVIQEALRLLDRRDELQRLRATLDLAEAQLDRGEGVEWTPELLPRLMREARENSRQRKPISLDVQP